MKTTASAIAIIATLVLSSTAASAQDGSATGCLSIGPFNPCVTVPVDVAPNAIDRAELAPAVRTELDGLQTDKADVTYVDQKNHDQDNVIATKADQSALDTVEQDSKDRDTVLDNKKVDKTRLDSFNGTGGSLETWASGIDTTNASQSAAIAGLQGDVSKLFKKNDKAFEGVAMALAMESPQVDPGKKFGISLNYGGFEGENAIAAAAKFRFDDTWAATAGVGYGMGQNTLGIRAGVQAQW